MSFVLLKIFTNEFDARLLQGRLQNEGIEAKLDSAHFSPSRYSRPDQFGVYVAEQEVEKAKIFII